MEMIEGNIENPLHLERIVKRSQILRIFPRQK